MGEATESDKPFIASVRELMADSTRHLCPASRASRVVPSDTLPTTPRPGSSLVTLQATTDSDEEAGFMLFDTVLARSRAPPDPHHRKRQDHGRRGPRVALSVRSCTKIEFVERELERMLSRSPQSNSAKLDVTSNVSREQFEQMVRTAKLHRGWRHLSGRPVAAVRSVDCDRSVHGLSRAASRESVAVHVFPPHRWAVDRRVIA